ncbi:transporter [Algoriphagus litoralis]|uniref:transporter n=1 Tax=Algoriphagus litoralis TaxID=2202829 RepID=UPI000DB9527B|nr:transporter [Algoriphagus litoralis]
MKKFISLLTLLLVTASLDNDSLAQGCVAIRQFSGIGNSVGQGNLLQKGEWNISANYRQFKSFRHFRGSHEEPERLENETEVINWSYGLDLNISYSFSDRLYGLISLPFAYNERSSLYEHGRTERHITYSGGFSDMRIGAGYWLLSGEKAQKGNLAFGLGVKLPTGDYAATSTFYNVGPNGEPEVRPVDQSIQLGDGGVGLVLDAQGIRSVGKSTFLYYSGFYMFNPKNTNGTETNRSRENEAIMSVADQFGFRAGVFQNIPKIHGLGVLLGGRAEGVPVRDIIGNSEGFRRPGYVISIEPGVSYMIGSMTATVNVPVPLYRNRTQSLTDIENTTPDREVHGDAAFADYLINVSLAWRIPKKAPAVFNSL